MDQVSPLPVVSASVVYTTVDSSSESSESTRSSCLSTENSSSRRSSLSSSLSSGGSTSFQFLAKTEVFSDLRFHSCLRSTTHGKPELSTFQCSSISSPSEAHVQVNQFSNLWAHQYWPSNFKMDGQGYQPPSLPPMVTTVFIGSPSNASNQPKQQTISNPSAYSYQPQSFAQQQISYPPPILSLPPPPLQFSCPSISTIPISNDNFNVDPQIPHSSFGLSSSSAFEASTSTFVTPNSFNDYNMLSSYSVHVPPPTHLPVVPNTLRVLQSTDFSTNTPVSAEPASFVNTSNQAELTFQSLLGQQQQLLQQQLEQYRQKQLELEQMDASDRSLNEQESCQLRQLHQLPFQQQQQQQQTQLQLQSLRPFSSLLLRSALNQQNTSAPHSPGALSSVSNPSPASTSTLPSENRNSKNSYSAFNQSRSCCSHSTTTKSDDREEVESGVGRSETCSDSLDSLCGRSSAGCSACTNRLSGESGQNFGSISKNDRNSLRSVDSALRVGSSADIEQQKAETHESQKKEAAAYAFCARRPAELTHCTHQIKFTKTPGFSCCSCFLLFLSLLLISIFLTTAVFFGGKLKKKI